MNESSPMNGAKIAVAPNARNRRKKGLDED
jgi:hypothetical protein